MGCEHPPLHELLLVLRAVPGVCQDTVALSPESHAPDSVPSSAISHDSGLLLTLSGLPLSCL